MHTRSIVFKTLLAALLAATMLTPASVALGYEPPVGCTPGYWKNHPDMWNKFDPYTSTVGDMFSAAWARFPQLADDPLIEALRYKGGPGLEGGARIMLRAAVAGALTNLLLISTSASWCLAARRTNSGSARVKRCSRGRRRSITTSTCTNARCKPPALTQPTPRGEAMMSLAPFASASVHMIRLAAGP
ncbi:MAG: hypothetical protein M5R40_25275 [Anaerolineae bacterium]|nr:hypothetical protein [Anaerolineae bacterium]